MKPIYLCIFVLYKNTNKKDTNKNCNMKSNIYVSIFGYFRFATGVYLTQLFKISLYV